MFMNDVNKQEEIRTIATQELKSLGIKYRYKKHRQHAQETKSRKTFKIPLHLLPTRTVTLESGQQLAIPKIIQNLCLFVLTNVETEGLFRKGGSKSRQNEIKLSLDAGCCLGDEHHEIDVASILKTFFRELPESLIPLPYHELFLKCILLEENQRLNAVLTACLLLPIEHLNALSYFMQFLKCVSSHHPLNKMTVFNLAVVYGPTLLPPDEKLVHNATLRLSKTTELFLLLIDNCQRIGTLSERIISQIRLDNKDHKADFGAGADIGNCEGVEEGGHRKKKKKKRRSGSLTRMFSGLKKIVVGGKETSQVTPDLLMTPVITRSSKKRKTDNGGISQKNRREIVNGLPQGTAMGTPLLSARTPISNHPNVKKTINTPDSTRKNNTQTKLQSTKEKKSQWYSRNKPKKPIADESLASTKAPKLLLERRWSAVSQVAAFKRSKKRLSMAANIIDADNEKTLRTNANPTKQETELGSDFSLESGDKNDSLNSAQYVRISKNEYEDIKNRVSEIERRISIELDSNKASVTDVQTAYEQTLEGADALSPTTDQLAKRFSRELKIRRSTDATVIRSPSARKIGSLRRKSRERQTTGNNKLSRNQSWHVTTSLNNKINDNLIDNIAVPTSNAANISEPIVMSCVTRTSSLRTKTFTSNNNSSQLSDKWTSAEGFFHSSFNPLGTVETCRASIAKLRMQNAGMVLAKARLFDNLIDSRDSLNLHQNASTEERPPLSHNPKQQQHRVPTNNGRISSMKIGAERDRLSVYRARAFLKEGQLQQQRRDTVNRKINVSPSKRCRVTSQVAFQRSPGLSGGGGRVLHRRRLELLKENARNDVIADRKQMTSKTTEANEITVSPKTPRNMPHIKRSLNTRSPRRINRTPARIDYIKTPLKVLNTPIITSHL